MTTATNALRCMGCGRFIPDADLASGKARHVMVTPDSHVSREEYDTTCAVCTAKERAEKKGGRR